MVLRLILYKGAIILADINLKRFVDIDIRSSVVRQIAGTRDTVVLFTEEGTADTKTVFSSYSQAEASLTKGTYPLALEYLKVFFENGGAKCLLVEKMKYSAVTADILANLANEYIVIAFAAADANVEDCYSKVKTLATTRATDVNIYGINEKILLARTKVTTDTASVKNFAVKYSKVVGAEMTIAAYLSQINMYKQNTVHDYAFTLERVTAEELTDDEFGKIMDAHLNVDIMLADSVRNLGGNCKDGADLTNTYSKIVLHQTLTDRLIALLAQKISGSAGVSQIYSVISQELERYREAGYLSTDKIWSNDDLTIVYNGEAYTVVEQGTALTSGYAVKVLPFSSLTDEDKAARKAPPVYVAIADQYGIRQITINGEVI